MFVEFRKPDGTLFTINTDSIVYVAAFDTKTTYLYVNGEKTPMTVEEPYKAVSEKLRDAEERECGAM